MTASPELRRIALQMLGAAHAARNAAESRVWLAQDEVTKLRRLLAEAEERLTVEHRYLERDQEFLMMLWHDLRPEALEPAAALALDSEPLP